MEQYLTIGKIVNTHGVKGEIKVLPLTDDINRFKNMKNIKVDIDGKLKDFNILSVKINNNTVILGLENINDMDAATRLKEHYIKINRVDAVKLPQNAYFISDLIDIDVETTEGEYLGKVADVMQPGSNDIYVVKSETNELLIPATKEVVQSIDIENRLMKVKLLEGLKDL